MRKYANCWFKAPTDQRGTAGAGAVAGAGAGAGAVAREAGKLYLFTPEHISSVAVAAVFFDFRRKHTQIMNFSSDEEDLLLLAVAEDEEHNKRFVLASVCY